MARRGSTRSAPAKSEARPALREPSPCIVGVRRESEQEIIRKDLLRLEWQSDLLSLLYEFRSRRGILSPRKETPKPEANETTHRAVDPIRQHKSMAIM